MGKNIASYLVPKLINYSIAHLNSCLDLNNLVLAVAIQKILSEKYRGNAFL